MWRSPVFLASLLLSLSSASFVSAQENSCSRRVVSIYVHDSQGNPITGLVPADFEAKVHGNPVKILSVAPDTRPHRLVLIVDVSDSMDSFGEPPRWRWQFALAQHFFVANRQKAQIALLIFSRRINEVVDFSQGNSKVDEKLRQAAKGYDYLRKDPKASTTLHDAILQGLLLFDHPSSADAIYVLTDAGDWVGITQGAPALIQRLVATQVRLFAVLLQREPDFGPKIPYEVDGPEELSQIARKSGGAILSTAEWHGNRVNLSANPDGKATTQDTLTRLYQAILQDSVMEIELPFPVEKNDSFQLRLSNSARDRWKRPQIMYPENLIDCGANPNP